MANTARAALFQNWTRPLPPPCAVLCPDCIGNRQKVALYREMGAPIEIGRFLLFLRK